MNATPAQIALAARIREAVKGDREFNVTIPCIREGFAPHVGRVTIEAAMGLLVAEGLVVEKTMRLRVKLNRARGAYTARYATFDAVAWQRA